ncbi:unnamed protein product [Effrenium voratum]|uniref:C3H1-type domain-containing protein n=1 Tax=Effrenium voratum TaxID=2562239 RepID=A0AA36JDY4_9DINO|nr:unnamed protein product [Effrenium voratum]
MLCVASPESMKLFGIPKREDGQALEEEPQSHRSAGSGDSRGSSNSPSYGQMKLVIKNTFIGGYDEQQEEDPPKTLARSASDSKLDCQSSASSVVFWYPQRGGAMSHSNSSVVSRSDTSEADVNEIVEHPIDPYHTVFSNRHPEERRRAEPQDVQLLHSHEMPFPHSLPASKAHGLGQSGLAPSRPPGQFHAAALRPQFDACQAARGHADFAMPAKLPNLDEPLSRPQDLDLLMNMQAEIADIAPSEQLVQLQLQMQQIQLQQSRLMNRQIADPMPMMNVPMRNEFPQAPAPAQAQIGQAGKPAMQLLQQQLLESQMQQLQLQQQMQQLQQQQMQLQQQLAGQVATPAADEEAILAQIPVNDEGERASLGSRLHPDSCNPCIFWFKDKALCNKGIMCDFCHFRHPGQKNKRIRPSKNTRLQMRAAQAAQEGP